MATRLLSIDDFIRALDLKNTFSRRNYTLDPRQISDIHTACNPLIKEAAFNKARGGSKSLDEGVITGLYWAHLGYAFVHYCSEADQMEQPKKYLALLMERTFLKYAAKEVLKESVLFKNGGSYEILNLTKGKARSRRIDVIYYDEECLADEDAFNASDATQSVSELALIRHGSTPQKGTIFERTVQRLQKEGLPYIVRKWWECPHIKTDVVERARKRGPAWFFRQEYECSFEAPSGRVFEHVIEGPIDLSKECDNYQRHYKHGGVDWNPRAGHYLSYTRWSDDLQRLYVLEERNLGTDIKIVYPTLIAEAVANPHAYYELEDGGTNAGFCEGFFLYCYDHQIPIEVVKRFYRRSWDSAGKNKHNSISALIPIDVYVDPMKCPETANWLQVAHWDETSSDPKLEKDPDQHALDAMLHSAWIGRWGVNYQNG